MFDVMIHSFYAAGCFLSNVYLASMMAQTGPFSLNLILWSLLYYERVTTQSNVYRWVAIKLLDCFILESNSYQEVATNIIMFYTIIFYTFRCSARFSYFKLSSVGSDILQSRGSISCPRCDLNILSNLKAYRFLCDPAYGLVYTMSSAPKSLFLPGDVKWILELLKTQFYVFFFLKTINDVEDELQSNDYAPSSPSLYWCRI